MGDRPSAHGRSPTAPWAIAHRPVGVEKIQDKNGGKAYSFVKLGLQNGFLAYINASYRTYYSTYNQKIMPIIEYDLYELPHAANSAAEAYYPVVVEHNKVNEDDICEYAEKSSTLNAADLKATFSMLANYLAERLANGDRVELPGIGSLVLRIGSDEPITNRDDNQIARTLRVNGINFTPKKELLQTIETDLHFHRAKNLHHTTPTLTDEEVVCRLQEFIRSNDKPLLTRADIQAATGYSKQRTLNSLKGWIERGLLIKLGTPHTPYYQLAQEFA